MCRLESSYPRLSACLSPLYPPVCVCVRSLIVKVLIHRYGIEVAAPEELGADKRLYAAGVEAFTGQRFAG